MPIARHTVVMNHDESQITIPERSFVVFEITHDDGRKLTVSVSGGGRLHFSDGTTNKHIAAEDLIGKVCNLPGEVYPDP